MSLYVPKPYPSARFHPELGSRVVRDADEAAALEASDKAWRDTPYPPKPEAPKPAELTVEQLKAQYADIQDQLAKAIAERDEMASQLPKLQADLARLTAAVSRSSKNKPAPAAPEAPKE